MMYRKYIPQKRSGVIICPEEMENFQNSDMTDENVIRILMDKYNSNFFELPPYHYVVSKNQIIPIKSLNLQHNDTSHLKAFDDDVKVLLLSNNFLFTQSENISKLISDISSIYCFKISTDTMFAKADANINQINQMDDIIKQAIQLRNLSNPMMAICESIINDTIIINEKVTMVNNRGCFTRLAQFSDQHSVPLSILEALNPHLRGRPLVVTDIVFVPNTVAYNGITYAESCRKQALYLHDRATKIIEGVI